MIKKKCFDCKNYYLCYVRRHFTSQANRDAVEDITGNDTRYLAIVQGIQKLLAENCLYYEREVK